MEQIVSNATKRNWQKLNTIESNDRLTSRANKRLSKKYIFPIEYFSNKDNAKVIQNLMCDITENSYDLPNTIYSLALNCLNKKQLLFNGSPTKENVEVLLQEYQDFTIIDTLVNYPIPLDEIDLLGLVYQCLKAEGTRNEKGMYYTPEHIARDMMKGLSFENHEKIIDPCCGSSIFLMCIDNINPQQLYGIDSDPIAVMISKFNLIMHFHEYDFAPQIYLADYLEMTSLDNISSNPIKEVDFDYIITNPPWGASINTQIKYKTNITSGESFSLFLEKSLAQTKIDGKVIFLLPESFLNVKTHKDIRELILSKYCLEKISLYSNIFSGVTTKFISVVIGNKQQQSYVKVNVNGDEESISIESYTRSKNFVFSFISSEDAKIIEKVYNNKSFDLSDSEWGLGIVTGDNKTKLSAQFVTDWEPIYTGKEISKYALLPYKNYIFYDRSQLQQVAKDDIYRAPEKLAYKFISNKLVFAYDDTGSLFLNSANILIPKIKGYNIKSVMAFLNSDLFQYIYIKKFGEIKILKGNIMELPFPHIAPNVDTKLSQLVDCFIQKKDEKYEREINQIIFDLFNITNRETKYIRGKLYGEAN